MAPLGWVQARLVPFGSAAHFGAIACLVRSSEAIDGDQDWEKGFSRKVVSWFGMLLTTFRKAANWLEKSRGGQGTCQSLGNVAS